MKTPIFKAFIALVLFSSVFDVCPKLRAQDHVTEIKGIMKYMVLDSMHAEGITRSRADSLFNNYHGTRNHQNSQGPMVVVDSNNDREALIHYSLSYDKVILPLLDKASKDPEVTKFIGFAGIHGKYPESGSNTMIWVAVIEKADGRSYYYLPSDSQANDNSFLYDYVDVCPDNCPDNDDRLWKVGWAE